jgi:protein-S-isoprenylcysteine O-methyltransferase Ste14
MNDPRIFTWIVYGTWVLVVLYLIAAGRNVKRDTQVDLGQSFGLMYALIAAFALPYVPILSFVNYAPVSVPLNVVGLIVFFAGAAFFVAARQQLGRNWSQVVASKEEQALVTSGPYGVVRHPMYFGGTVMCLGAAIVVGGAFACMLVTLLPIFIWRVGAEDRLMTQQFPSAYPTYMHRTKGLIPLVW